MTRLATHEPQNQAVLADGRRIARSLVLWRKRFLATGNLTLDVTAVERSAPNKRICLAFAVHAITSNTSLRESSCSITSVRSSSKILRNNDDREKLLHAFVVRTKKVFEHIHA